MDDWQLKCKQSDFMLFTHLLTSGAGNAGQWHLLLFPIANKLATPPDVTTAAHCNLGVVVLFVWAISQSVQ